MRSSSAIAFVAALVGLGVAGCGSAQITRTAPPMVSVFPIPGDRVASPQTQIAFRGLPIRQVRKLVVTGSRTGVHAGRLESDSDHDGGSFLPAKPFDPGEVVTVSTGLHILGASAGTFHFTVAAPSGSIPATPLPPAGRVPGDELTFQSRPDLTPASVEITQEDPAPGPDGDDIFITPQQGPTQNGAMILDKQGTLVWFQPVPQGDMAADLQVQTYEGQHVLTWWQGYSGAGVGAGEDVIENSAYRQIAVVHAANGLFADLHEFRLTPHGTALITAYYPVFWNATDVHMSPRQVVLDSVVQEIDVKTGLLLFQWDSLDHVPLSDAYEPAVTSAGAPFDYFHINSVQLQPDGNLLISARNTWAAYEVDHRTGQVVWTLGGKNSSYKLGSGAEFAFQHDVRLHTDTDPTVTLFDDGAGPPKVHSESRGMVVRLDDKNMTATLVDQQVHSPALAASFEGNVQELPGGDDFLGWGQQPYFSEYNDHGQVVFDGRFVGNNSSYRAYRFPWIGTPTTLPSVTTTTSGATTNVYVSWNGATKVASWRVLAGASGDALQAVATAAKQGFETQVTIAAQPYVEVQALDSAGRVLATSSIVPPG
ncbi:MAG TPA: arylsulfotransferase family protein [Solirubrobacteraceae bacterium]|jgi:Arylsulfotransferase (ASST)|nr:arylsulfotransferase family protein [Solirubrobacteraceae bacterium]